MICNRLFLCLFGISACILASIAARETILGGRPVRTDDLFPYQVSVRVHDHNHTCGGGFFNNQYILTAAQCVVSNGEIIGSHMSILAGTYDLRRTEAPSVIAQVKKIFLPNEYFRNNLVADIAVLELESSVEMPHIGNPSTWRLQLPSPNINETERIAVIAGWGRGHQLEFADARVLSHRQCQGIHHRISIKEEAMFCAKVKHEIGSKLRGVCNGDEGSPLRMGQSVIGILSQIAYECDEMPTSAIYTRVSYYVHLIYGAVTDNHRDGIRSRVLPTH